VFPTSPRLVDDLRQVVEEHGGAPIYIVDAATKESYVIVRANQYEKVKALFEQEGDSDQREEQPFIDVAMRENDADDPLMNATSV
jgi:hypothetical protein